MPAAQCPINPAPAAAPEVDQLERLVRTTPAAWLLSTLGAVICYVEYAPPTRSPLTAWLVAFCAISTMRLVAALYATHLRPAALTSHGWRRGWLASTYVHAAQWGLLPVVLATPGSAEAEAILHITLVAIAMGGSVRLPGFRRTLYAHVLLVLGPLILRDLMTGNPHHALMAMLVFLITVYALVSGRNQSGALLQIHEQRRRNAELIEALQRENARSDAALRAAESASAARTRFFAAANHDLRQPLHAMGLLSQTLLARDGAAASPEIARHLSDCVDGMTEVVDDLLEITRLDGGHMTPQWSVFPAADLIRECCRIYETSARAKGLQFSTAIEAAAVRSDRTLLMRVLSNLVANAIRYTAQGSVRVAATVRDERLHVVVEDTGIGIAEEHLPRIFEEFYQVGNPARDRRLGLGLGLATVQRLGELLSLEVAVQSAPGRGSVFSFVLPIVAGAATDALPPADGAESLLPVRRVLVIEDDADSRLALLGLLRSWGCDARGAEGLADGLACIEAGFRPEAAVVDLRLADGASGIDAVHALRARLGGDLPAVIATGDVGSAAMRRAQAEGLSVMVKPVRAVQLRAFLSQSFSTAD
ncbi:hybrid sensor histidine kinase/response regulator [uncultured Methylibium sp.]|uniref:ATP-binding response regulator n=1 Tax=uncultured Methylibium sp. TaxID=381093 RepID=UPI0025FD27FE|nr:hybrid sensor histidine kinase/response regulator [uncultured Methylibium sp.]